MRQRVLTQLRHRAAGFFNHVVGSRSPRWNHGARHVWNRNQQVVLFLFGFGKLLCDAALRFFQKCHFLFGLLGLVTLPLFHQSADRGRKAVEFRSLVVVVELKLAATVVQGKYAVDGFLAIKPLHRQACDNFGGIRFYLL